jgi:hypothetical protein
MTVALAKFGIALIDNFVLSAGQLEIRGCLRGKGPRGTLELTTEGMLVTTEGIRITQVPGT